MCKKKNIAVLFGARSLEHEISVISAIQAMDALDRSKYTVIPVYIAQSGIWYTGEHLFSRSFYKTLPAGFSSLTPIYFLPEPVTGGLFKKSQSRLFGKREERIPVDVYLPIFHGQTGEDGCIQGLFELGEVPYAGSSVLASSIAMNKYICKAVFSHHGIPVLPAVTIFATDARKDISLVCSETLKSEGLVSFPLFVKPGNLGSSVGVSKACSLEELQAALFKVFQYDQEAIVEPCIDEIMEINVSVIESQNGAHVSVVEVPVASGEFLSYEDKYLRQGKGKKGGGFSNSAGMASLTRVINPDNLDAQIKDKVRSYAIEGFRILNCGGVTRFDFIVDLSSGQIYFNELNPIPGSLSFYLWEKSEPLFLMPDILDRMIDGALSRYIDKSRLKKDFGFKALAN
jgi:D-alanine-D-alanine ligase